MYGCEIWTVKKADRQRIDAKAESLTPTPVLSSGSILIGLCLWCLVVNYLKHHPTGVSGTTAEDRFRGWVLEKEEELVHGPFYA